MANATTRRGRLVWFFALPLLPGAFAALEGGSPSRAVGYFAALAAFVVAARSIRHGVAEQNRRLASRFSTVRTHRRTWLGAALVAAAVLFTNVALSGHSLAVAVPLGMIGFAGIYLAYGAVTRRRVTEGAHGYSAEEIAELLGRGEQDVNAIERAARSVRDREVRMRLLRVVVKAHRILNEVHEDPADLRRARRFFSVFLPGMREVCESYLKTGSHAGNVRIIDRRFLDVLARMEHMVDSQHSALERADALDHDVRREVLETQIDATWGARKAS